MRYEEAVKHFNEDMLPELRALEAEQGDGSPDWPMRREVWNNWTDMLCKNGIISDWQYENWSHPRSCED